MRTRVTAKAWFGPKRYLGWGWTPVSWEGWLVTGIFGALVIASPIFWVGRVEVPIVGLVVVFLGVVVLTGDPPGGPG